MAENERARAAAAAEAAKIEGGKDTKKKAPKADVEASDTDEKKKLIVKINKKEASKAAREEEAKVVKEEAENIAEDGETSLLAKTKEVAGKTKEVATAIPGKTVDWTVRKGRKAKRKFENDPNFKYEAAAGRWLGRELDFSVVDVVGVLTRKATNLVLKPAFSLLSNLFGALERIGGDNPWLKWVPGFMKPDAIEGEDIVSAPGVSQKDKGK